MDALNKTLCETFNDEESGDSVEISDLSIELEESDVDENPNALELQPYRFEPEMSADEDNSFASIDIRVAEEPVQWRLQDLSWYDLQ